MKNVRTNVTYLLAFILILSSCKKETETIDATPGASIFVSATSSGTFTKTTLQAVAVASGFGSYVSLINYDVDFYKLIYKTSFKGNTIQASGLLAIPKNVSKPPSLLSAQHGTIFKFSDAPSNFPATFTGFELFASAGFVTVIPDFIGYGISQNIPHPYYDMQSSGTSVADMINAAKYYLAKQNTAISNRLFLIGYSEGGYVTMAAQKEIETNAAQGLNLTAAAEGAGGYDLTGILSAVATTSTYSTPSFLALFLRGYESTYNWNRPFTDFFQQPYAGKIPALLNGTKSGDEIDAELNSSPAALFNPVFYANLLNPTGETALKQQLAANSFLNWVPKSPTRLYHGTADVTVNYQTSVTTFNKFKAAGATNVQFIPIQGGTHATSVQPMIQDALPWILSLDK